MSSRRATRAVFGYWLPYIHKIWSEGKLQQDLNECNLATCKILFNLRKTSYNILAFEFCIYKLLGNEQPVASFLPYLSCLLFVSVFRSETIVSVSTILSSLAHTPYMRCRFPGKMDARIHLFRLVNEYKLCCNWRSQSFVKYRKRPLM